MEAHPRPLLLGDGWYADRPGGLNRYFADLYAALHDIDIDARGVVLGPAVGAPVGITVAGRRDDALPLRMLCFRRAASAVGRDRTVVDAHFALNAWLPVLASRLRRRPLVVHFQGPWAEEGRIQGGRHGRFTPLKRAIERSVYRRADTIVVLSQPFKDILVERYGVAPWRIEVIPPGVDLSRFQPGDKAAARAALGLAPDAAVLVAVRRLVPRMGLDVLLDAWARLDVRARGVLMLVGDGSEREALEAQANRLGVEGSVRLMGRVDDGTLVRCYQAADLAVVPSLALEGFGLIVLEALACGTPVIASDTGGLPAALAGLDPSLIVPPGDAAALAARVAGAVDGSGPVPDADACRRHAEGYSWLAVAARHRDLFASVATESTGKPRVVYVDHCALLSGGELALLRLLPALDSVDAHVILAEEGPLRDKLMEAGVPVEVLPMVETARNLNRSRVRFGRATLAAALASAAYTLRLARRLRQLKPDIVHTNSLKASIYGGVAGRLAGIPVVWHVRDRIADDYLPAPAVRLVKAMAKVLPTAVIGNSQSTLDALGPTPAPQAVVSSPVHIDRSKTSPDNAGSHGPFRVGIIGRLAPWKGQHVFLDAFARAFPDSGAEAVVVGAALFGESDYEASLHEQAVALGLDGRVDFRGFRADVAAEMARLDVVVHASTSPEPFGQVVVEAMAMGLPVVAADAGGPAEVIDTEVNGLLYTAGDAAALAVAMRRLVGDAELRAELGAAGQERARQFRPEVIAGLVESVYRPILVGAGR